MKTSKIFECACVNGYTGDFCEFKTEQDHLLFFSNESPLVFDAPGRKFEEDAVIDMQAEANGFCSIMLNGEAISFGGINPNFIRQVKIK